ncbi:hypothetical protein [Shinella oryzae]|uniref:Uncharacterized protein n=1 Tax=Shinella oryzae TaxID=2871820 RepID=A0ABY9KBD3_9HYPH|nr:hypothetical protein [Shinella oryzae]WLS05295.1 hypothetical protein Q9315_24420 [Shinella oryzae]
MQGTQGYELDRCQVRIACVALEDGKVPLISLAQQVPDLLTNLVKPAACSCSSLSSAMVAPIFDISFVFVQNAANRNTIYARISFMLGASRATLEFATQRQTPWR